MNFSHNQLTGLVPGGTQFRRLNCTSFEDNPGLFGPSLDEVCRDIHAPTPHETPESKEVEAEEEEETRVVHEPFCPKQTQTPHHHSSLKRSFIAYLRNLKMKSKAATIKLLCSFGTF
ncbi:Uncharacterized protein Rs2_25566 [Raphanus sativus]|nr:Uncharacterized protein Rs2_25566 [Raphanus sativus]